jgi:hypothetical protein
MTAHEQKQHEKMLDDMAELKARVKELEAVLTRAEEFVKSWGDLNGEDWPLYIGVITDVHRCIGKRSEFTDGTKPS